MQRITRPDLWSSISLSTLASLSTYQYNHLYDIATQVTVPESTIACRVVKELLVQGVKRRVLELLLELDNDASLVQHILTDIVVHGSEASVAALMHAAIDMDYRYSNNTDNQETAIHRVFSLLQSNHHAASQSVSKTKSKRTKL
jgi:hypothetical protein